MKSALKKAGKKARAVLLFLVIYLTLASVLLMLSHLVGMGWMVYFVAGIYSFVVLAFYHFDHAFPVYEENRNVRQMVWQGMALAGLVIVFWPLYLAVYGKQVVRYLKFVR